MHCIRDTDTQYMLNAAGKVIQIGIVNSGMNTIYHQNFLIVGVKFEVELVVILSSEMKAPSTGNIQYGSGLERSLNQRKPSVSIQGCSSKLYE